MNYSRTYHRLFKSMPLLMNNRRAYCYASSNKFFRYLKSKMQFSGPLTVHEYMQEVLTNPLSGYYMKQDVFGAEGDYITSPEISFMFSEMIATWIFNEWFKFGQTRPMHLVELGPGRGTLMKSIIKIFLNGGIKPKDFSVHFVEKSPFLSNLQEEKLCSSKSSSTSQEDLINAKGCYKEGYTKEGVNVCWYTHLEGVPKAYTFFLAHEFFDALPIHKFRKTRSGWREVLIDIPPNYQEEKGPSQPFRYILSPSSTPSSIFINENETRKEVEICPEAGVIVGQMASRLRESGGAALIVDYGHNGTGEDTFRAFKKHTQVSPLLEPGTADLTADVDFSFLRSQAEGAALCYGPVPQADFLIDIGINFRLEGLLEKNEKLTDEQKDALEAQYNMLVGRQHMGQRFKVMALFPKAADIVLGVYPPKGGFVPL